MTKLPERIFFTGVPGSRWSGIAQTIEALPGFNTTDRSSAREYEHCLFSGHKGAYFGRGMEFPAELNLSMIDSAWEDASQGTRLVKSHDWAYMLDEIYSLTRNTGDKIMLIHRPNEISFNWWKQAGGFDIVYPNYDAYIDDDTMMLEIQNQNHAILNFAEKHSVVLEDFDLQWIKQNFEVTEMCTLTSANMTQFAGITVGII